MLDTCMIKIDGELVGCILCSLPVSPEVWSWDPNLFEEYGHEG
jgi:hypothetical protein